MYKVIIETEASGTAITVEANSQEEARQKGIDYIAENNLGSAYSVTSVSEVESE